MRNKYVKVNAGKCLKCGEILISWFQHDFQQCKCGQFVDGGFVYCRRTLGLKDVPLYLKVEKREKSKKGMES